MEASGYFKGKKITVMGLGLLGRGVGDIRYLAECGAKLIVTDLKSEEELVASKAELKNFPIAWRLGRHDLADFRDRDLILKAPKTPLNSEFIKEAEKNGIPITMSTALFAKYAKEAGATIVGVTGTRGKTTTTEMIAHILRTAGKQVLVGGNIQGVSTLAMLPDVASDTIAILELDSWQLQGFGAEKISPDIAVFTNLYPDHQDYYGNMYAYLADKINIFIHGFPGSVLIAGPEIAQHLEEQRLLLASNTKIASSERLPDNLILQVPGEHNRADAACAVEASRALGIPDKIIISALKSFGGVPGRLELVREVNGVKYYNDTTATTPEATLAALSALDSGTKNIVLIMGGSDKGLDMNALLPAVLKHAKRVIMLSGSGTSRVLPFLPGASVFDSFPAAFKEAVDAALPGDIVLLSPSFASFGMFKNEYDRGDQFNRLTQAL